MGGVEEAVSKGPQAFRTISEVAEELELPQHVLRFWETRFAQVKPMKRGGGRRYYRPDDIELLRGIRHLLYGEGYTIRGVQRILKEQGPRVVVSAGKGEVAGFAARRIPTDDEPILDDDAVAIAVDDDDDETVELAFNGREFHAAHIGANGSANGRPTSDPLSGDELRSLQTALTELIEMKRLLDQTR